MDLSAEFAAIYREKEPFVRGLLLRLVRDQDLADDLSQETFLRAWRAFPTYERRGKIGTWLITIAFNAARNHFRRVKALRHAAPAGLVELDNDQIRADIGREGVAEISLALEEALRSRSLYPGDLRAFLAHHVDGLSHGEMVAQGISLSAGKSATYRARKALRAQLWRHRGTTVVETHREL